MGDKNKDYNNIFKKERQFHRANDFNSAGLGLPKGMLPILSFPPLEQINHFTRPELSVPFTYLHKQLSKGCPPPPWSFVILPLVSMAILVIF